MSIWDVTTPAGTESANQGDDRIREMKNAIQDSLRGETSEGLEAIFPGSAPSTAPVFRYRGLSGVSGARPLAGQYGLYFDTTRNALQRDNGSAWVDVGTVIPVGTVCVFYQTATPVGFTQVITQNDKVLVVSGGGGGGTAGGTDSIIAPPSHHHAVAGHVLAESELPAHTHPLNKNYAFDGTGSATGYGIVGIGTINAYTATGILERGASLLTGSTGSSAAHSHGDTADVVGFSPAYITVIICTKT